MIIVLPFILALTFGLLDQEPAARAFLLLADLGLVILAVLHFRRKSRLTIVLQCAVYFMLLAPLVRLLVVFPREEFAYSLFWAPFAGFVLLYPVSVVLAGLENRNR